MIGRHSTRFVFMVLSLFFIKLLAVLQLFLRGEMRYAYPRPVGCRQGLCGTLGPVERGKVSDTRPDIPTKTSRWPFSGYFGTTSRTASRITSRSGPEPGSCLDLLFRGGGVTTPFLSPSGLSFLPMRRNEATTALAPPLEGGIIPAGGNPTHPARPSWVSLFIGERVVREQWGEIVAVLLPPSPFSLFIPRGDFN